jgi:dihydropteroate synthase
VKTYYRPLGILSGDAARQAAPKLELFPDRSSLHPHLASSIKGEGYESEALPLDGGGLGGGDLNVGSPLTANTLALSLASGPLAFALVEMIERRGPGDTVRSLAAAAPLSEALERHTMPRRGLAHLPLDPPLVMGIVNATPDSFSDGGAFLDAGRAVAHAKAMIDAGARIVDIGGESTRPGAQAIPIEEEIRRVAPVIAGLRAYAEAAGALISVDTRNAATMAAALDAGAGLLNDISALTHDPESMALAAGSGASVVLMHMQGDPETMQRAPRYDDVALDVYDYLEGRIAACLEAGMTPDRIVVDPGIGFGKTVEQNVALLNQLPIFHGLGVKLLVGVSRKGFIGKLSANEPPSERLPGSLAAALAAIARGAQIVRVHDVAETVQALKVSRAIS